MECCNQINAKKSFRPFRFAALLGEKASGERSTSFKHKDLSDHCISGRLRQVVNTYLLGMYACLRQQVHVCLYVYVTVQGLVSLSVTKTKQKMNFQAQLKTTRELQTDKLMSGFYMGGAQCKKRFLKNSWRKDLDCDRRWVRHEV